MWEGLYQDWKDLSARGIGEVTPHIRMGAYGWYATSYGPHGNDWLKKAADDWCKKQNDAREQRRIARIRGRVWPRPGQFVTVPGPVHLSFWKRWFGC